MKPRWSIGAALALSLVLPRAPAQSPGAPDPASVLEKSRSWLQAISQNLEKYVCVETVDRSYFEPPEQPGQPPRLESTDRVRLEVTVSQGRELHSWPGATRFDERNVDELIRNGPVSTGSFGGYLDAIFAQPGTAYRFQGESTAGGRPLFDYAFSVPMADSRFQVKTADGWRPAAYEGEFRVDPRNLELEGLTVHTTTLPAGAAFTQATTHLAYHIVHIGDSDVLLPRESQLDIQLHSGQTRNVTTFANCREYQAESEISFGASAESGGPSAQSGGRGRVALPLGLPVTLVLMTPIDTATAAAGDAVEAKLAAPVRRPGAAGELLPAGATVRGRIRRVEHRLLPEPYFRVVLAFNRVDVDGVVSPFVARSEPEKALAKKLEVDLEPRDSGLFYWGVGTFLFPSKEPHLVIPAGFQSRWFTLATGGR